jgi:hypothetical protein
MSDGGDVRIGTLDCGGHAGVPPGVFSSNSSNSRSGVVISAGGDGGDGSSGSGGGGGGAEVASGGGRITVDGLEGYVRLESGGGDVKVGLAAGRGREWEAWQVGSGEFDWLSSRTVYRRYWRAQDCGTP